MASKLNQIALKEYSERVSQELCDSFFDKVPTIQGKHLLHFSDIKQVNYFLVKLLFQRWLEEGEHLQSPYFDYSAPDVQEAFAYLNNVLSHHIQIRRTYFEPLLAEAVLDTLKLTLAPYTFFDKEFERFGANIHLQRDFLAICRYIRIHGLLRDNIYTKFKAAASNQMIGAQQARDLVIQAMDDVSDFDDPKPILRYFNQILAFKIQDFIKKESPKPVDSLTTPTVPPYVPPVADKEKKEVNQASPHDLTAIADQTLYSAEQTYMAEVEKNEVKVEQKNQEDSKKESSISDEVPESVKSSESANDSAAPQESAKAISAEEDNKEIAIASTTPEQVAAVIAETEVETKKETVTNDSAAPQESAKAISAEEDNKEIAIASTTPEQVAAVIAETEVETKKETVTNDSAAPQESAKAISAEEDNKEIAIASTTPEQVAAVIESKAEPEITEAKANAEPVRVIAPRRSIRESLNTENKHIFVKELFGGDSAVLEEALSGIDASPSYKEAVMEIRNKYHYKYDWDLLKSEVREFYANISDLF